MSRRLLLLEIDATTDECWNCTCWHYDNGYFCDAFRRALWHIGRTKRRCPECLAAEKRAKGVKK